jgi:hypothetical protein
MCRGSVQNISAPHYLDKLQLRCDINKIDTGIQVKKEQSYIQKKQIRKHFTTTLSKELMHQVQILRAIDHLSGAGGIPTQDLDRYYKQFDRMRLCANRIEIEQGQIGKVYYCHNKLCSVCNANKQGGLINRYKGFFNQYRQNLKMVTLTFKNVTAQNLHQAYIDQKRAFTLIKNTINRYLSRNKYDKLKGILKLETTFNPVTREYHPHLHIVIVDNQIEYKSSKMMLSELIKVKWMNKIKSMGYQISQSAQDIRPCTNLKELFKYITKSSYSIDGSKVQKVHVEPLLNIYHAMQKIQSVKHFGFVMDEYAETISKETICEADLFRNKALENIPTAYNDIYEWNTLYNDWYSFKTDTRLGQMELEYNQSKYIHREIGWNKAKQDIQRHLQIQSDNQ